MLRGHVEKVSDPGLDSGDILVDFRCNSVTFLSSFSRSYEVLRGVGETVDSGDDSGYTTVNIRYLGFSLGIGQNRPESVTNRLETNGIPLN